MQKKYNHIALVRSYTEDGFKPIPSIYLSSEEHGRALQRFVPACADIVPIDRDRQIIYLARRISKPMTGSWWIGGSMKAGETKEEAAVRNFQRETGLRIDPERLRLEAVFDYRWKDRQQEPQGMSCHTGGCYTFTIQLTEDELATASQNLEPREYQNGMGLSGFNRERLVSESVFPAILDLYNHLFPENEKK